MQKSAVNSLKDLNFTSLELLPKKKPVCEHGYADRDIVLLFSVCSCMSVRLSVCRDVAALYLNERTFRQTFNLDHLLGTSA